ncbi:hypothetical protein TNCV_4909861, partial [Trichonephila clavipes]
KYNGSVDMRLLPLRCQRILRASHVPSLAAPFPVGDIALSFPFETICWGMLRGLAIAPSTSQSAILKMR